jgi:hypothetical protein
MQHFYRDGFANFIAIPRMNLDIIEVFNGTTDIQALKM